MPTAPSALEAASQDAAPLVDYVPLPSPHADTHTQIFISTLQNIITQDMPIAHAAVRIKTAHLAVATTMGDVHTLKWIVGFPTLIFIPIQRNTTFLGVLGMRIRPQIRVKLMLGRLLEVLWVGL